MLRDIFSQRLIGHIKEWIERHETPLSQISLGLSEVKAKVNAHLQKMGFVW
jgi:type I restriction enzyme M protein